MSLNDPLSNVLSQINNAEAKGFRECTITPVSKLILAVLSNLRDNGYLGSFEIVSKSRGGQVKVNLIGNINKCGVVKPRFSFTKKDIEVFEKRYLPAKDFGFFVVTTSKGVMIHKDALKKGLGGKLLAYCY